MRIPLLLGRDFTRQDVRPPGDTEFGFRVAIANQKFVEKYLRGVDPLGRRVGFGGGINTPHANRDRRRGRHVEVRQYSR